MMNKEIAKTLLKIAKEILAGTSSTRIEPVQALRIIKSKRMTVFEASHGLGLNSRKIINMVKSMIKKNGKDSIEAMLFEDGNVGFRFGSYPQDFVTFE